MLLWQLGSLDDKSEEGDNSILQMVSFWPISQQFLFLEFEFGVTKSMYVIVSIRKNE